MEDQVTPEGEDELRPEDSDDRRGRRNPALAAGKARRKKERRRAIALLPEVRYFAPSEVEIRSVPETDEITISGSPVVYAPTSYRVVDPWGEFEERVHAGSVTDLLSRGVDCRLLLNHEGMPMARTTSGTMDLWDTDKSLRFAARLDARQQLANDFHLAIARRDITQMSVGMIVGDDEWGTEGSTETRDIYVLRDLLDVSGVTYPASPSTSIEVAHRMALQQPVESRARLRRFYLDGRAGKALAPERFEALRSLLDVDPGEDLATPDGTGRLGAPDGDGDTYASLGDGTEQATTAVTVQDGSGSRSEDPPAETRDEEPKTSRNTRHRVGRALRGL